MPLDLCEDLGRLQQASCIRQLTFRIAAVPADRFDLPADLYTADIGARLIGGHFVLQREPSAGAIGDLEPLRVVCRHQVAQSAS